MVTEYIDLVLFAALLIDLFLKSRRYRKVKKMMRNCKRYVYNDTKLKKVLYAIIFILSGVYLVYRFYTIFIGQSWQFPQIFVLIPAIDYYVIWDLLFHGIYYNNKAIFYKSEYYEFRSAVHIYRDLVKDHYEYEMTYRLKEGGLRTVYLKVPNEKEAFPLLAAIPFEEE